MLDFILVPESWSQMEKSIFSKDYAVFLVHLKAARRKSGLTQDELAKRLGQTQSFISKCERGERRIDVVELRQFCLAIGISLTDFISTLQTEMEKVSGKEGRVR